MSKMCIKVRNKLYGNNPKTFKLVSKCNLLTLYTGKRTCKQEMKRNKSYTTRGKKKMKETKL